MPNAVLGRLKFELWVVWHDPCLMLSQVGLARDTPEACVVSGSFLGCVRFFGFESFLGWVGF